MFLDTYDIFASPSRSAISRRNPTPINSAAPMAKDWEKDEWGESRKAGRKEGK
jgi:hypothetical protein